MRYVLTMATIVQDCVRVYFVSEDILVEFEKKMCNKF